MTSRSKRFRNPRSAGRSPPMSGSNCSAKKVFAWRFDLVVWCGVRVLSQTIVVYRSAIKTCRSLLLTRAPKPIDSNKTCDGAFQ